MKRFYKDVTVAEGEGGFRVLLDGRAVKTPAKNELLLPTRALAEAVAQEWREQGEEIVPAIMPMLKLANTAIDGVAANRAAVIAAILRFGENDHLCYRAIQPADLAARQAEAWDPVLAWAQKRFGVQFIVVRGHTHADQSPQTLAALRAVLEKQDEFTLAGLHVIASIAGSLVLALALLAGECSAARVFALSRIDEDYQADKWGRDREAEARAAGLSREIQNAARFIAGTGC
jgi:chaperone required for assembly of F1-ATPase